MDFADILDKWEKRGSGFVSYDKDNAPAKENKSSGERRNRLLRKKPDDTIDLHGMKRNEAWAALELFFENSRKNGYEKLLVIHGKGNHINEKSAEEGILKDLTRQFIESCSFAGENGHNPGREGGSGATWVILKERR